MKARACGLIATIFLVSVSFAQQAIPEQHRRPQVPPQPTSSPAPQPTYNPPPQPTYNPPPQPTYYPQQQQTYYPPQPQVTYSSFCVAPGISGWMPSAQVVGTQCIVLDANNNAYAGVVQ